jgi:adenosylhomocysteinase
MSARVTNQVMAQIELHRHADEYERKGYRLPKARDEKVTRFHRGRRGGRCSNP